MRKLSLSVLLLLLLLGIAAANTKSSLVNSLSKETHEDFIKALKSSDNLENNQDDILNSKMQVIIDRARVNYQLPALSVSVKLPEENSTRNYNSGYYSLSKKKKITADTLFQIGSITKTFTATIVLKLAEENKLALNDKIIKWLPQYPRWHEITIKNLLSHTSGVYNYTHGDNFDNRLRKTPDKNWSLSELANIAYHHADLSKPSQEYRYTNTDYVLLGLIIEKITHKSIEHVFEQYLHEYRLNNTFYAASKYLSNTMNRIAHGYNRDGTFKFNKDVTFVSMSFSQSAGAMIATPNDLINWLNQLFTEKIITNKSLTDMMTLLSETDAKPVTLQKVSLSNALINQQPFTEIGTGLGIGLVYFKDYGFTWVHAGGMPGYESFYAYNPCNGIYVVLMYNAKPKHQLIFTKIASDIFNVLNSSVLVRKYVKTYQRNNSLPMYCQAHEVIRN